VEFPCQACRGAHLARAPVGFAHHPLAELGFIRISMTPATMLPSPTLRRFWPISPLASRRVGAGGPPAARLPALASHADVTDAYLVEIARAHGLKLATLDSELCRQAWAAGVAENPALTNKMPDDLVPMELKEQAQHGGYIVHGSIQVSRNPGSSLGAIWLASKMGNLARAG